MPVLSPTTSWASRYLEKGISVFPVDGKKPLVSWKDLQSTLPEKWIVEEWFERQFTFANIGIATGKLSGIFVLDVDGEEGRKSMEGRELPLTPMVRTRRGYQYYFKWQEELNNVTTTAAGILGPDSGVDIRGNGGFVVAPPSTCSDGSRYVWIPGRSLFDVPLASAPSWLISLLIVAPKQSNSLEVNRLNEIGTNQPWYTDIINGVKNGQRHDAFKKLAPYYIGRMAPDLARHHLEEWNKKNTPPMDERDFDYQFTWYVNAFKKGDYVSKFASTLPSQNPTSSLAIPSELETVDARTFLASAPAKIDWLVPGLLPRESAAILGGMQKLGKSWMLLDLALEIARGGGNWFSHFPVNGGKVLYIDEESAEQLLRYRLNKLLTAKGLHGHSLDFHLAVGKGLTLNNPHSELNLRQRIEKIKPDIVIIDSLIRCHSLEENSASEMRRVFGIVKNMIRDYKSVFLFADHERKPSQFDSQASQRLRGTTEKAAFVDSLISLKKDKGLLVVEHSASRYSRPTDSFSIAIEDISGGTQVRFLGYLA